MGSPAFHNRRLSTQPEGEDVPGRVHVAVVDLSTGGAPPLSYSETCDTSRPLRRKNPRQRAGLGRELLPHLCVGCSVPAGLVAEHVAEGGQSGVEHGLGKFCPGEPRAGHVPDVNCTETTYDLRRLLVQVIASDVRDLGVQSTHPASVVRTLRDCEFRLIPTKCPHGRELFARGEGRERLEPEVDPDGVSSAVLIVGNDNVEADPPAATGVLDEAAAPDMYIPERAPF